METVGQRIKMLRERLRLSQADLAEKCGWGYQSRVGNYETGSRKVSVEVLKLDCEPEAGSFRKLQIRQGYGSAPGCVASTQDRAETGHP